MKTASTIVGLLLAASTQIAWPQASPNHNSKVHMDARSAEIQSRYGHLVEKLMHQLHPETLQDEVVEMLNALLQDALADQEIPMEEAATLSKGIEEILCSKENKPVANCDEVNQALKAVLDLYQSPITNELSTNLAIEQLMSATVNWVEQNPTPIKITK